MKILVTGGSGSIASYMKNYFLEDKVYCLDKNSLDVTDKIHSFDIVKSINPNVVIHLAAITDIKRCEDDETSAYVVNTLGTLNLASACSIIDIPIVYISTNNVFDGSSASEYGENDLCSPANCYGKTKLAGESLIRTLCEKYYIIRTSWIFGSNRCIVKETLLQKGFVYLPYFEEVANLTYIEDLCSTIKVMLQSNNYGIYNFANCGAVSKENWIRKSYSIMKFPLELHRRNQNSTQPKEPKYAPLNCCHITSTFNIKQVYWEERLEYYLEKEKSR